MVAHDQGVGHVLAPARQREVQDVVVRGAVADALVGAEVRAGVGAEVEDGGWVEWGAEDGGEHGLFVWWVG